MKYFYYCLAVVALIYVAGFVVAGIDIVIFPLLFIAAIGTFLLFAGTTLAYLLSRMLVKIIKLCQKQ